MEQVLGTAPADVQKELYSTLLAQNQLMSNMGMLVTGKEEDVTSLQYTFSGLSDVYEQFMMDLAGAAEMPVTKLFGRSPAGLNATGESDMQNYYDSIEEKQEAYLSPILDKLLPVMACSEWGGVPDDMDWEFNPVRRPTEDERKSLSEQISSAVFEGYNTGLITQRMALKELRQSTELTGMWSNITDEDIERASDEYESSMNDLMGGFGGGGFGEPGQAPGQEPQREKPFSLDGLTVDFNKYHEEANGRFAHAPDGGGGGGSGEEENAKPPEDVARLLGKEHDGVKGQAAINLLLKEKNGHVKGAFHRKEIGDIDLLWGDDTFGIKHIIKRRNEEGFDGKSFVQELPKVIVNGRLKKSSKGRFEIVLGERKAIIAPELRDNKLVFLLTAYEID
jgi:hypothetical protein